MGFWIIWQQMAAEPPASSTNYLTARQIFFSLELFVQTNQEYASSTNYLTARQRLKTIFCCFICVRTQMIAHASSTNYPTAR